MARMFRISSARVSQLRRELCANWHRFVGELADASAAISGDGLMSAASAVDGQPAPRASPVGLAGEAHRR